MVGILCDSVTVNYHLDRMGKRANRAIRATEPMVRRNGHLEPCSWDEALETVSAAFRRASDRGADRSFGMFSCSKTTNELNYAAQKFVRTVIGSNNIDSCNRT